MTQTKAELLQTRHQGDIRLGDADSTNYVGFKAPATVGSNLVWTLPATDGSANQFLQTNASGVLSWGTADTSASMPKTGGIFTGNVTFNDGIKSRFGSDADLEVYHDGTNAYFKNATGDILFKHGSEDLIALQDDGEVQLFYDGSQRLRTNSAGIYITGTLTVSTNATITGDLTVSGTTTTINTQTLDVEDKNVVIGKVSSPSDTTADGGGWTLKGATDKTFNWINATDAWTSSEHIHLIDNKKLFVGGASGTTDGLEIFHDSSDSYVKDNGTGRLVIETNGSDVSMKAGSDNMVVAAKDGAVTLYHDNSAKIATTSGGINVTGAINVNGSALSTAPQITATTDGALTAGDAVIIKPDGDVKKAGFDITVNSPPTVSSSKTALNAGGADILRSASFFIPSTNKIITTYEKGGTDCSMHIGEVSDSGAFTFSGYNDIDSDELHGQMGFAYDTNASKGVALYFVTSNKVYARVITFSGNTLNAQSRVEVYSGGSGGFHGQRLIFDSTNNKVIAFYVTQAGTQARVGTVSGNSTSWGTAVNVTSVSAESVALQYDTATQRVIALVEKQSNGQLDAYVGTVSGTNISFGSAQTAMAGGYGVGNSDMAYDSTNNKVVVVYTAGGSAYAKVGTITGGSTNTISWGSQSSAWDTGSPNSLNTGFDPLSSRIVVQAFRGGARIASGVISGTTISFTATSLGPISLYGGQETSLTVAQAGQAITIGRDTSPQGPHASVTQISTSATNITAENYIGIASASASDNATATIDVSGATNSNQSSLTAGQKYFVQNNGSLGLTAASPAVFAGTAISATKLIVNDQQPVPDGGWHLLIKNNFTIDSSHNGNGNSHTITEVLNTTYAKYNFLKLVIFVYVDNGDIDEFGVQHLFDDSTNQYKDSHYSSQSFAASNGSDHSAARSTSSAFASFKRMSADQHHAEAVLSLPQQSGLAKVWNVSNMGWRNTLGSDDQHVAHVMSGHKTSTDPLKGIRFRFGSIGGSNSGKCFYRLLGME